MENSGRVLLAGATGLVGGLVLDRALSAGHHVTTIGRRPTARVDAEIITDFESPVDLASFDVAICALGTTIADAGSKTAFRTVDYDAVMYVAELARRAGAGQFMVVTAVGASKNATAFYSRVKGEVEEDLESMGFNRLDIAQPGLLLGERDQRRPAEAFFQKIAPVAACILRGPLQRYAGIHAESVAEALVSLIGAESPGVFRYENANLESLISSNGDR